MSKQLVLSVFIGYSSTFVSTAVTVLCWLGKERFLAVLLSSDPGWCSTGSARLLSFEEKPVFNQLPVSIPGGQWYTPLL